VSARDALIRNSLAVLDAIEIAVANDAAARGIKAKDEFDTRLDEFFRARVNNAVRIFCALQVAP
jgi:hypothetical protein